MSVYGKVPRRFRMKIGPDHAVKRHPNGSDAEWFYGCYFPQTDLCVGEMGRLGTGRPDNVEWLDPVADEWKPEPPLLNLPGTHC